MKTKKENDIKTTQIIQSFIKVAQMREFDLEELHIDEKRVSIKFKRRGL
jgi:hypothetical protein